MGSTRFVLGIFVCTVFLSLAGVSSVYAQATQSLCDDNVAGKSEEQLRADLALCNAEIQQWQNVLNGTRNRVSTIDGDVKALTAKIKAAEATIKAKNIAISQLSSDINVRSLKLTDLENDIAEGKKSLAQLMRRTREIDDYTLAEVILDSKNISDFFVDVDAFLDIKTGMKQHFAELRSKIQTVSDERALLSEVQNQELDAKYIVETTKETISQTEQEKRTLLAATQQEAKSYEQIVADRQAKASQINAALFRLRGVDGGGIPFKEALAYAQTASAKTGVRTALILGILRQESDRGANGDFGVNVGQCLLVDTKTGDGKGKNTGTPFLGLMKPDRDVQPFLSLMKRLGRDPYTTPVSCSGPTWYGGGMGPTQFIPSTWQGFEPRVAGAFGVAVGDPWNPQHAIMATALYMQDLGAGSQTYTAERNAACRYYSGAACTPGRSPANVFYGDSVISHATGYQRDIDFLENR